MELSAMELIDTSAFMAASKGVSASHILGTIVGGLSALHAVVPVLDEAFALVPHHTIFSPVAFIPIPFCWNLITAHFFEGNVLKAIVVVPWLLALVKMLERLWSLRAVALHLTFSTACSGVVVFIMEVVRVHRTHKESEFFKPVRGCIGLLVTVAVGLRHAYPFEAIPMLPRSWGLQCQQLPFGLTTVTTVVGLIAPRWLPEWPFAPLALIFGWLHIRYLIWFPYADTHGDHSPEFGFAALFPRVLRPFISCVGELVYGFGLIVMPSLVKLRQADETLGHSMVYDPAQAESPASSQGNGGLHTPRGPSTELPLPAQAVQSQEYNARRAKALALLDEHIGSLLAPEKSKDAAFTFPQEELDLRCEEGINSDKHL